MARRIRIPHLADLVLVDRLSEIRELDRNRRIDRGGATGAPWLNRVLQSRLTEILQVDGAPLPAFRARDDATRRAVQKSVESRLGSVTVDTLLADPEIDAVADWVRGSGRDGLAAIGPAMQGMVGRLFKPDYRADGDSYRAARKIDRFLSIDPVRGAILVLSGAIGRALRLLSERADGDPAAIHATAIAFHNLLRSTEKMRADFRRGGLQHRVDEQTVAGRCLTAPPTVLRSVDKTVLFPALRKPVPPGALVLCRLGKATEGRADANAVFQRGSWAQCPAHHAVPVMLSAIWRRANAEVSAS